MAITCKVELFWGFELQKKTAIFLSHHINVNAVVTHNVHYQGWRHWQDSLCVCVISQEELLSLGWEGTWLLFPSLWSLCSLSPVPLYPFSICLFPSSLCSDPFIPPSRALPLLCPRRCRPAGFDQGAREGRGSGSESCAGDCRRTRLEYRVGEAEREGERERWGNLVRKW